MLDVDVVLAKKAECFHQLVHRGPFFATAFAIVVLVY
jgi:hypothetical protein